MRILLSSFAFAPNVGSEPGVGWRWAMELGKDHEVTVLTDSSRRSVIEASGVKLPESVQIEYYRPNFLRGAPLNSATAQLLYSLWQYCLLLPARRLHGTRRYDAVIHITYGVFRHPSFLGLLGIPFIFGPLGGGEDAPWKLKRSIRGRERSKELVRWVINKLSLFNPFLWVAYSSSSVILVKTAETGRALPWPFRRRAVVYPEIGVDAKNVVVASAKRAMGEPLRVLFVGRLLGWKGAHLAVRAVARAIQGGVDIDFTLVGTGPFEGEVRRVADSVGLKGKINWIARVPQDELFEMYQTMHCFLFPSLHDSSGNVVLEAQAHGLPVVCLDLGGPGVLVNREAGIVIPTDRSDEETVVNDLASALMELGRDEARRLEMSRVGIKWAAEEMTWSRRVSGVISML